MKILITGGSGRLGNVLVRELVSQGHEVHVLVIPNEPKPKSLKKLPVHQHIGNILDKKSLKKAMKGADIVFHLAAKVRYAPDEDGSIWAVNVTGTRYVAKMCLKLGVKRMIHCSSHHALEHQPYSIPLDETRPLALETGTDYHRSKAHAEQIILELTATKGLPAIIVSPGRAIGPYEYEPSLLSKAFLDLYKGEVSTLIEGTGDYVDVRDVAQGMIQAAQKGKIGERYILSGWMLKTRELLEVIEKVTGKKIPVKVLPLWMAQATIPLIKLSHKILGAEAPITKEMLEASQSNPKILHAKAKEELGFQTRDVEESMKDLFEWYKRKNWIE